MDITSNLQASPNNGLAKEHPIRTSTTTSNDSASSVNHHPDTVPVIIVGAGPVGLLLALRLAQSKVRCVVLEKDRSLSQAPRAIGYYGPVHQVFNEAGIYDQVVNEGMISGGYVWRKRVADDGRGGKKLGRVLGQNVMAKAGPDGKYDMGHYSVQLPQSRLAEILLEKALETGFLNIYWEHPVTSLSQDMNGVTALVKTTDGSKTFRTQYLVGCDGGKSTIRKLLGIRLSGHSWPERFVATDVLRTPPVIADIPVHFVIDPVHWGVVTPLEQVTANTRGLWRYSMAVTDSTLTDEEVLAAAHVDELLLHQIDGPWPSDHKVVRKSLYKMHQLLANTMHRGRCFLAGDSAHINNPIGGLGLCTGLLDADALYQTLDLVLSGKVSNADQLFAYYSSSRRFLFQTVIHPSSSANKTRLHGGDPDETAQEDWYLQALRRGDPTELAQIHRPLYEGWRTNMLQFAHLVD